MRLGHAISVAHKSSQNDNHIYTGMLDSEWCIQAVPNGGYVLGQIVEACLLHQYHSLHKDPIHVTAFFLHAASLSPFEVHIRQIKQGKNFTNIAAEFFQDSTRRVSAHLIFGVLEPPSIKSQEGTTNLLPPSPYARRLPLHHHPSTAPRSKFSDRYKFHSRFNITAEPEIADRNAVNSNRRTDSSTIGGGGLDYALWCGFSDEEESVTISSIPFLADISANVPVLLPKEHRKGLGRSWFPTLVMSVEYKYSVPRASQVHSNRTLGVFSSTRFLQGELGRHDMYTELWTAPCDVGANIEANEGWRDNQICIAVSTQMALTVPMAKNLAKANL